MFVEPYFDIRELSKPQRQRHRERRQTKGLMSKIIAVHVRYKSLYILLPFSTKQQRDQNDQVLHILENLSLKGKYLNFLMEMIAGIT